MNHVAATPRRPAFLQGYETEPTVVSPAFSGELRAQSSASRLRVVSPEPAHAVDVAPAPPPASALPEEILLQQALAAAQAAPLAPPAPPPAPVIDMSRMEAAIERLRLTSERLAADVRADALEVAMMLARKIVEGEVTTSVDRMMGMVRSAVRRLGESRRVTIRLCPEDAQLLSNGGNRSPSDIAGLSAARVEVVADATLTRGDCLVEGELGSVDARIDTRFAELRRAIAEDATEGAEV